MKIINISKKKFDNLQPLTLSDNILNTECELFLLEEKNKWDAKIKLLKKLYVTDGIIFGNKLQTINSLIKLRDEIEIKELVLPEKLASVSNQIVGYVMPYISSINLSEALSSKISNEQKINYLYQVGEILKKMQIIREHTVYTDFYLNDLHINNFIVDNHTNEVKAVDLDSCKIDGNYVFASKNLTSRAPIKNVHKYNHVKKENDLHCGGVFIPDENTENYCYIIMILNFLYDSDITKISLEEFYNYIEYLNDLKVNPKLLDIFTNILTNQDNENPADYLEELTPYIGKSSQYTYKYLKKKNL